jgi:hypothetical protein
VICTVNHGRANDAWATIFCIATRAAFTLIRKTDLAGIEFYPGTENYPMGGGHASSGHPDGLESSSERDRRAQ